MAKRQTRLAGRSVAFLATDGVEEIEYVQPRTAVEQAGARVELLSIESGPIQSMRQDIEKSKTYPVDRTVSRVDPADYDALVLPGGAVNPDRLRMDEAAMNFVRAFFEQGKPVAAICHGPWSLVEADVLVGRTLTSYPSLRTDIINAGGTWVDEPVQVDFGLVTSRRPDDLPAFCEKMIEEIAEGQHARQMMSA
nr:type 1 glutamine amidotransferase domain-containing protein [Micromonospora sp. DSM 115978]